MKGKNLSRLPELLTGLGEEIPSKKDFLITDNKTSYGQFREQVAKTRGLFSRLKLKTTDRVVVASSDKLTVAVIYIACILEGVTAVVLDPNASSSEITVLLTQSQASLAFFDKSIIENAELLRREEISIEIFPISITKSTRTAFSLIIRKSSNNSDSSDYPEILDNEKLVTEHKDIDESTPALILFTSGTTSKPKGVQLTHLNLASQVQTFINHFNLNEKNKLINHLPLHHSDGLNQGALLSLAIGGSWIAPNTASLNNIANMLDIIYKERATHLITIPTVLAMMQRLPSTYDDSFSSSEFCFIESTAGPLNEKLWFDIEKRFKVKIVNCYGLTETVCEATYCGPDEDSRKIGTIGKPVGCEVRLINESGLDSKIDEPGELFLRGDNIMQKYFNDSVATDSAFHDGWFSTGDLATYDADGFYKIVGRKSSIIIRGGINIQPEEISSVLLTHPYVKEAATIGINDDVMGEKVICCVTLRESHSEKTIQTLLEHCRNKLAEEKVPNNIFLLKILPYGPSGKVDLLALQEIIEQKEREANSTSPSTTSLDNKVFSIAANVFHVPVSELDYKSSQNNTDGWNSLSFLEFIMSIEKNFEIKVEPKEIMNIIFIEDMITIINNRQ